MTNIIKTFSHPQFGETRVFIRDGNPWFVGKDIADKLGYLKPQNAILAHVDNEDKTTALIQGTGSNYKTQAIIINESGLYSLILSSKLPKAREFKHWVTGEVLPQIRQTGGYIPISRPSKSPCLGGLPNEQGTNIHPKQGGLEGLDDSEILSRALMIAQKTIDLKNKQLEQQKDKVEFAEAVVASKGSIYIAQLANLLYQNGYETGQNRLFQTLRDRGYLYKTKNGTRPMQCYVESGLFEVNVSVWESDDGDKHESFTTMVTPKGQKYFVNLFC